MIKTDILIIGGGASGCVAAIEAGRTAPGASVLIAEKGSRLLEKVKKTGNGRCNISNTNCKSHRMVEEFFNSIGVIFAVEDEGRAYPYNRRSESVIKALTDALSGVKVMTDCYVEDLRYEDGVFTAYTGSGRIRADLCLIATGGKEGEGYIFARKLGHRVKTMVPSLTGIRVAGDISSLKGVRAKGRVTLYRKGKEIASEQGEIQFGKDYLSGICIMNLSRYLVLDDETSFSDYELELNLVPDIPEDELRDMIKRGCLVSLADEKINRLYDDISSVKMGVSGALGWKYAQVSRGGVELNGIDCNGESEIVPGLFFAGEVTDYDGPCGGYNLNNAWTTGIKCGREMGRRCTG